VIGLVLKYRVTIKEIDTFNVIKTVSLVMRTKLINIPLLFGCNEYGGGTSLVEVGIYHCNTL
jgi:hypothetical protein